MSNCRLSTNMNDTINIDSSYYIATANLLLLMIKLRILNISVEIFSRK